MSLVGMNACANKTVDALSFGQKKRICIAGVLAMKPEILVLDEPTCGLDPVGVTSLMTLLKELNGKHGITIIMATNTVDLVPVYMNRLAIMYHGNILKAGTPERGVFKYRRNTACLFGTSPDCTVDADFKGRRSSSHGQVASYGWRSKKVFDIQTI